MTWRWPGSKPAKWMSGTVAIVQEGRIGLIDDAGAGHVFLLSHASLAEPHQLAELQRRQARVRVRYADAPDLIGFIARSITVETPA